jgi:hypothetical protein
MWETGADRNDTLLDAISAYTVPLHVRDLSRLIVLSRERIFEWQPWCQNRLREICRCEHDNG